MKSTILRSISPSLFALILATLALTPWAQAEAEHPDLQGISEFEYGELFVTQSKPEVAHPWQVGASYAYGFTNPYLGIHGFGLSFAYQWNRYIQTGVASSFFATQETPLASRLTSELAAQDIETKIARPFYSAYVTFAVIPLSGVVNLFSLRSVGLEMPVQLGLGASRYVDAAHLYPSFRIGITPQAFFTEHAGVQLGLHTQLEHFGGGEWQNRWDAQIGFVGRL